MFELNLYGIEIAAANGMHERPIVWIEPLWNWNDRQLQQDRDAASFELNLYGIEMQVCTRLLRLIRQFELNLYGIEMNRSMHPA